MGGLHEALKNLDQDFMLEVSSRPAGGKLDQVDLSVRDRELREEYPALFGLATYMKERLALRGDPKMPRRAIYSGIDWLAMALAQVAQVENLNDQFPDLQGLQAAIEEDDDEAESSDS